MMKLKPLAAWLVPGLTLAALLTPGHTEESSPAGAANQKGLRLGAFSVSLKVKDLAASRAFYEKLGFTRLGGDGKTYLVLKNESAVLGLFQGMIDKNLLTFNPGWDQGARAVREFDDVREIQKRLKTAGVELLRTAPEDSTGPDHLLLSDPDGNQILVDQHVPRPGK